MVDTKELVQTWLKEEQIAHIKGWDFSHIHGRYEEENDLPWNYKELVLHYLKPDMNLLDIDTGGGEFLLSLHHPYHNTYATEAYKPNVQLCEKILLPLGIHFQQADGCDILPFADQTFDLIINRHGDYNADELYRILKPGGIFITEQVGAENDRDLVELLLPKVPDIPFPKQYLHIAEETFKNRGFSIIEANEAFRPIKFWDIGALVWFAHIIEWEFPGFSVKSSLDQLFHLQQILETKGVVEGKIHRFLLIVKK